MINQCAKLHHAKTALLCSYFLFFAPTAAAHHAIMMSKMQMGLNNPFGAEAAQWMATMLVIMVSGCVFKIAKLPSKPQFITTTTISINGR
jgi:hypothetical protein